MADVCREQCQLVDDTASGFVDALLCGSAAVPLFQSLLDTPPDGTFFAEIAPSLCTVTFTFQQCDGRMVSRSFTPGLANDGNGLAITLTVPDVRSITATCSGGELGSTCSIFWTFLPHYCRCCRA